MSLKIWFDKIIKISNPNKNLKEIEKKLNILLIFSIIGFLLINLTEIFDWKNNLKIHYLTIIITFSILSFLFLLFYLSKKGKTKISIWLFILTYTIPMCLLTIKGSDLHLTLLLAILIIGLLALLIRANLALISAISISVFIVIVAYFQKTKLVNFNNSWPETSEQISAIIVYVLLLLIISTLIWLFSRNLREALSRAQESEKKLQEDKKLLEKKILEKTKELYQAQEEKMFELYRLAKFGRLASGIFHDLINPLTAISLNLEQVSKGKNNIINAKTCLQEALLATQRMEEMISGIKKQIQQKSSPSLFNVNQEIKHTIQILNYKAQRAQVKIKFIFTERINFYGDVVKFGQIIINLLSNAIEANEDLNKNLKEKNNLKKIVKINLSKKKKGLIILVKDQGIGINPNNINKIFNPFFSTKKEEGRGLGLGLSSIKNIIKHNFYGDIKVKSRKNLGSKFIVFLPFKFKKIETKN